MQCQPTHISPFMLSAQRIKLITAAYTINKNHKKSNKIMNKHIKIPKMKKQMELLRVLHRGRLKKHTFYETPVKYYFHSRNNI